MKGFRTVLSQMYYFGVSIFLSWRKSKPCGLKRNFYLSLKEFKFGALPIIEVITRNNFSWPMYRAAQHSNDWTSARLIVLWSTLLPSEVSGHRTSLLSSGCHTHLMLPFCLWNSHMWALWLTHVHGVPGCMYVITFAYFLLLICLM